MIHWLFTVVALIQQTGVSLYCFEGTDCELNGGCDQCEGVACLRVVRPIRQSFYIHSYETTPQPHSIVGGIRQMLRGENADFHGPNIQTALTCLPADTTRLELEPEGCRTNQLSRLRTCVCYNTDYCNSAASIRFSVFVFLLLFTLPRAFQFP
ncbi:hypothetical protein M3Y98_00137000 [Aphelenchoides besseyi]|nr:hypothetical protein M3Y98_00137000 [Aphelenchoides besseyi]KAI6199665.1 hypothetical protein M3Y96_00651000 [Aphelenchoides besseyi]